MINRTFTAYVRWEKPFPSIEQIEVEADLDTVEREVQAVLDRDHQPGGLILDIEESPDREEPR